jgi:hypothetical protein
MCICSFTSSSILCKQLEPFKDKNRHKEFLEITVLFSLHIDSVTFRKVVCRNDTCALIKYPTVVRQSMRHNLGVYARVCFCVEPMRII